MVPGSSSAHTFAALVALVLTSGCNVVRDRREFTHDSAFTPVATLREPVVQLHFGPIPGLRAIAIHGWFADFDPARGTWRRMEVWQNPGTTEDDWGHLRRDLFPHDTWITDGQWIHAEWRGDEARRIQAVLDRPLDYPNRDTYRYWPGPNSNTFPAWVLREAGVSADLPSRAIGKDHFWLLGGAGLTPSRTGIQLETPLVGVAIGLLDGVELHVLCGTLIGIDFWPPAIETYFGRLGWPE